MTKSRVNSRLIQNTAIIIPTGTTGQRPTAANGYFRYNTSSSNFEGYINNSWNAILANTANLSFDGTSLTAVNNINLPNNFGFKNRILNGDFRIDQRNNGGSVAITTSGAYTLDHWEAVATQNSKLTLQRNAGSVTPPPGFTNYIGVTSLSAYSITSTDLFRISTPVEGSHMSDFAWGTAYAKPITISFYVRSSLTGTFGGAIQNANNNRAFPFTYTINSVNTWERKTIFVPGELTGSWNTDVNLGLRIQWGLGVGSTKVSTAGLWAAGDYNGAPGAVSVVGTNGATWYMTGAQIETGVNATDFEFRDIGREEILCQRYFERAYPYTTNWNTSTSVFRTSGVWKVTKRTNPTLTFNGGYFQYGPGGQQNISSISNVTTSIHGFVMDVNTPGGLTTNYPSVAAWDLSVSSEL